MDGVDMHGTKLLIFQTAVDMFAKRGYDSVSMRDIASAVGIKPASIYNHFESKEQLLSCAFDYFDGCAAACAPDTDKLMKMAQRLRPHDVLMKSVVRFDARFQPWMDNIIVIASALSRCDPRAQALLHRWLVETPRATMGAVMQRLIELKRIAPLDTDAFLALYSSYIYASVLRAGADCELPGAAWDGGLSMLFSVIKITG